MCWGPIGLRSKLKTVSMCAWDQPLAGISSFVMTSLRWEGTGCDVDDQSPATTKNKASNSLEDVGTLVSRSTVKWCYQHGLRGCSMYLNLYTQFLLLKVNEVAFLYNPTNQKRMVQMIIKIVLAVYISIKP